MPKLTINNFAEFEQHIGKELGVSDYHQITQEQINQFAEATLDRQWIHTDPERAKTESQFKSTIAHGYLTLSLIPYLWEQVAQVNNFTMLVNYGIENLKFNQPVLVNQYVRLHVVLQALTNLRGITKTEMKVTLEIKDNPKPAFTATIVFLYHFK
ncbi:MAG: MaoC family dehydratase [Cyclobacteriaceae bacterium]|nr:MaoC family dehydratase [Cyclobacteriaceae bacterium]UYN85384.1 MAG: MaoC family dehydratase [Cyclobacteriaceae bacterium]